ncbi:MAG: hypothetical protein ACHQ0I_04490, partial [Candidatus Lutacidiplasmatales archaeon]
YSIGRRVPARLFIQLAEVGDSAGVFPSQFVLAHRPDGSSPAPLPVWNEFLACPACRAPFGSIDPHQKATLVCSVCGVRTEVGDEWIDARLSAAYSSDARGGAVPPSGPRA